jgi:hypothetical protein
MMIFLAEITDSFKKILDCNTALRQKKFFNHFQGCYICIQKSALTYTSAIISPKMYAPPPLTYDQKKNAPPPQKSFRPVAGLRFIKATFKTYKRWVFMSLYR